MRIQHNIMAMNAYRNYNTNTSALSKNLEKLSSGYKINRAGDDAAGLAISEKMRAQITGLDAAQKNVKDGISLVKTAEGAMQEIQDMLNRMDYLATQSANGTYQDEVDREALQQEVEQLKTEINRIADSANFNGIKLLDGSLDTSTKAADAAAEAVKNAIVYEDLSSSKIQKLMLPKSTSNDPNDSSDGVGLGTILETDSSGDAAPGFTISLDGIETVLSDYDSTDTTANSTSSFTITINGVAKTLSQDDLAKFAGITADGADAKIDSKTLAQAIANSMNYTFTDTTHNNDTYNVEVDGDKLVFTATNNLDTTPLRHYDASINGIGKAEVAATKNSYEADAYAAGTATSTDTLSSTVSVELADGTTADFEVEGLASSTTTAQLVTALKNSKATIDGQEVRLSELFNVTESSNKIKFEALKGGTEGAKVTGFEVEDTAAANGASLGTGTPTEVEGKDKYTVGTTGYSNDATQVNVSVTDVTEDQLASTTLDLSGKLVDGAKITLGDQSYVIAIGENSAYKDMENAVYLKDAAATEEQIASKLSEVAKNNTTFTVGHNAGTDAKITLKQLSSVKDSTDMSTMEKFAGYIGYASVDADATKKAQAEAQAAADEAAAKVGKPLTLQIGDTSDDFNQMKVSVGDMHTSAMGIADIDIGTQDGAAAAVQTVKDAINYVSSVRGTLGAIQNRLDHTANNLSVMAENIQDAESTIRDTDVAEEMMSYVKNNILVQSAQAMLAQANQVPQGVLQLLG